MLFAPKAQGRQTKEGLTLTLAARQFCLFKGEVSSTVKTTYVVPLSLHNKRWNKWIIYFNIFFLALFIPLSLLFWSCTLLKGHIFRGSGKAQLPQTSITSVSWSCSRHTPFPHSLTRLCSSHRAVWSLLLKSSGVCTARERQKYSVNILLPFVIKILN